jgi:hypothetical protein
VHDECNGSDVFGSDICTCRPYLAHGVEVCIEMAQQGGVGSSSTTARKAARSVEVTKFLVYNAAESARSAGDRAATYFERTECVAGGQDMALPELMPDVFHWLGISRIDRWASMSNMSTTRSPRRYLRGRAGRDSRRPHSADARVEMDAKKAAGYYAPEGADTRDGDRKGRARRVSSSMRAPAFDLAAAWHTPVPDSHLAANLLSTVAVRTRCAMIMTAAERGQRGISLAPERLPPPPPTWRTRSGNAIPLSTFRITAAGATSKRAASIAGRISRPCCQPIAPSGARTRIDLAITSVLLDAGAGAPGGMSMRQRADARALGGPRRGGTSPVRRGASRRARAAAAAPMRAHLPLGTATLAPDSR